MIMDLSCKVTANLDFERARLAAQLQPAKSPDLSIQIRGPDRRQESLTKLTSSKNQEKLIFCFAKIEF